MQTTHTETKLWTPDFLTNAVANFFIYLVYYLLIVVMASYSIDYLHATPSEAGLAGGLFIVSGLIARILTGRVIERVGEKRMLFVGLAIYLLTTFLYFPVGDLAGLYAVRFLHGLGFGISASGAGTIAARIIPAERRGEGVGYYALTTTLASAIGPFAGMYLSQSGNFSLIFVISAVLLSASCVVASFIRLPKRQAHERMELSESCRRKVCGVRVWTFLEARSLPISATCALVVLGYSGVLAFLTPFAKESDLVTAGNAFFLVYSVFVLISRPITGKLFDAKGENFITYPAILLFAVGLLILGIAHEGPYLLLSAAIIGFGYGTFFSSANAIALKVAHQDRIHLSTSTYFAFADLGAGIGPFLLGFAVPSLGFRGLYVALAAFTLCCVIFYHFAHGAKASAGRVRANG